MHVFFPKQFFAPWSGSAICLNSIVLKQEFKHIVEPGQGTNTCLRKKKHVINQFRFSIFFFRLKLPHHSQKPPQPTEKNHKKQLLRSHLKHQKLKLNWKVSIEESYPLVLNLLFKSV